MFLMLMLIGVFKSKVFWLSLYDLFFFEFGPEKCNSILILKFLKNYFKVLKPYHNTDGDVVHLNDVRVEKDNHVDIGRAHGLPVGP